MYGRPLIKAGRRRTVIPIFWEKVERLIENLYQWCYTFDIHMDHEPLLVTLFFTFMLGAGAGFYIARWLF